MSVYQLCEDFIKPSISVIIHFAVKCFNQVFKYILLYPSNEILHLPFQDFSSIFSTLLPGARAKLSHPEGHSVLDGLEVKVGFGDVWKESLSELSGGQRYVLPPGLKEL